MANMTTFADYVRRRWALSGLEQAAASYPYNSPIEGLVPGSGATALTSFAHYDYLALGHEPAVRSAAADAAELIGVGAGASRLVGGELAIHRKLEREFADFLKVDDTLALVSGYGTNVALVGHLMTKGDLIVVDDAAHNSIMMGTRLSRATTHAFPHNDLDYLELLLKHQRSRFGRALLVIEGLYSMDGDIPDLPRLLALCRKHGTWLMIDEAHSIGVLGQHGRGITEHFGIPATDIDLIIGTLSKAFVACGGFIAGNRSVISWLRYTLPGFVYSVGLPPPTAATALCALERLQCEPARLTRLRDNSHYFLRAAISRGLNVGTAIGAAVVPVLFRDTASALAAGKAALEAGFFVPPIVQMGVPKEAPRLRFFVTASHSRSEIDAVLDVIAPFACVSDAPVVERPS